MNAVNRSLLEPNGTSQAVVPLLVDHIRRHRLAPGDRLDSIRDLAARFGLGTNVVRDGLLQAQAMGLVQIRPRSGIFIQSVEPPPHVPDRRDLVERALGDTVHNYFHLVEARRVIEVETAGQAAERRRVEDLLPLSQALRRMESAGPDVSVLVAGDEAFHLGISAIAGNPVFTQMLETFLHSLRTFRETLLPTPESRERTRRQHNEIYQRIRAGDPEGARAAMREHLTHHYQHLLDSLEAFEPGAADNPPLPE
jgi:GntR family transcriptional regulator, transcriptional repressor for pyruvate dehydrogenase complex